MTLQVRINDLTKNRIVKLCEATGLKQIKIVELAVEQFYKSTIEGKGITINFKQKGGVTWKQNN